MKNNDNTNLEQNNTTTTTSIFSTWASRHQKDNHWQWHQLDHMQIICILLKAGNDTSTSPLSFYRPDALPATQLTASKH